MQGTVTMSMLDALLRSLGFEASAVGSRGSGKQAEESGEAQWVCYLAPGKPYLFVLPALPDDAPAPRHCLVAVRTQLDFWGLVPHEEFPSRIAQTACS